MRIKMETNKKERRRRGWIDYVDRDGDKKKIKT